jgi:hypothetical protein
MTVTDQLAEDAACWELHPDELVGRCLICLEESDQQECDACAERERRRWER